MAFYRARNAGNRMECSRLDDKHIYIYRVERWKKYASHKLVDVNICISVCMYICGSIKHGEKRRKINFYVEKVRASKHEN